MNNEQDIRAWVRDESKKVLQETAIQRDQASDAVHRLQLELAHSKEVAELNLKARLNENKKPIGPDGKVALWIATLIAILIGAAIYAAHTSPSDSERCVKLCEPKGVLKWAPANPSAYRICECRP